jgi:hypothetical protein
MIKQVLAILFLGAALILSAQTTAGVPEGSTEIKPGTYRFVDKDKKVWIYRKTPFGLQKSEETAGAEGERARKPDAPAVPAQQPDPARTATPFGESKAPATGLPATRVTDAGDSLRFERPSPFGVYRWTRKKSELTADEKKLWEAQQTASPAQAGK